MDGEGIEEMFCDDSSLCANGGEIDLLIPFQEFLKKEIEGFHGLFIQMDPKCLCPSVRIFLFSASMIESHIIKTELLLQRFHSIRLADSSKIPPLSMGERQG